MSKPTVGYWDIRGLGQPIRLLLTYLNIDFEDVRYTNPEGWFSKKFDMGFAFPNLPYYMDGDVKMTQTFAILRHLARKHKMDGKTEQEMIDISLMEEMVRDLAFGFARVAYNEKCDELKPDYLKVLPTHLKQIAEFMKDRKYVAGDHLTYIDFWAYEGLVKFHILTPDLMAPHDNLKQYIQRIEALPAIAAYKSKQEPKLFNGPTAKWNGTY
jgi:glutathione S-transferase